MDTQSHDAINNVLRRLKSENARLQTIVDDIRRALNPEQPGLIEEDGLAHAVASRLASANQQGIENVTEESMVALFQTVMNEGHEGLDWKGGSLMETLSRAVAACCAAAARHRFGPAHSGRRRFGSPSRSADSRRS